MMDGTHPRPTPAWIATFKQNGEGNELPTQAAWFRDRVTTYGVDVESIGPADSAGLAVVYRTEPADGALAAFGKEGSDENAIVGTYLGMIAQEWSPGPLTARGVAAADDTHGVEWSVDPDWVYEFDLATPPRAEVDFEAFLGRVVETASPWEGD